MTLPLATFFRARLARLAPTCVASTLIVVAATGQHFSPGDIVRTLLVLPLIATPSQTNVMMWSLAVEWCLYLAFPLLLLALPRSRGRRLLALAICEAGFAILALKGADGSGIISGPLVLLRGLFPFVAGMLICGGMRGGGSTGSVSATTEGGRASTRSVRRYCAKALPFLDSPPIRWLGEISLPLYLCQIVPLRLMGQSLWAIPAAIALAAAVHYAVEVPGRRWLRANLIWSPR